MQLERPSGTPNGDVKRSRLIVVSNRLPFTVGPNGDEWEFSASSGGLVSALSAYLATKRAEDPGFECLWVGWPGAAVPIHEQPRIKARARALHGAHPVFLSEEDTRGFYQGFSNTTLWPLFHYFPSYVEYHPQQWEAYERVNRLFRDAVLEVLEPGDTVWVHDYQLMLLPAQLRAARPGAAIGFFLHIPFPSYELVRLLPGPWKRELLSGMLGADLVGFHTHEYTQHFLHSVFRVIGYDHWLGAISVGDQVLRADTFPIGIDFSQFMTAAVSDGVLQRRAELEAGLRERKVIFSVDRLDYTKGILNRLRGFEEFLERFPEWSEKVVFALTVIPSRIDVRQYRRMKQELDERVGRINGRFGSTEWVPILYQYRSLDFESLVALYSVAPVALITPLRDGMNLVAKEYLASKPDSSGVLILSEMAGAARELGEALIVNPNHASEIADALYQALTMPLEEQIRRNGLMQERLKVYDAKRWAQHFLSTLTKVKAQQGQLATHHVNERHEAEIAAEYAASEHPLIFLDYDGTLVPFAAQPHLAAPDPEIVTVLSALMRASRNGLYIVSGRDRATLESWFGAIGVGMIAEHGAWVRPPGASWRLPKPLFCDWKELIAPILRTYVAQVSGSLFEEKDFSLAWHYRRCEPELGAQRAKELIDELVHYTANLDVQVLEGKKVVEIRSSGVNKGAAALLVASEMPADFLLAIGDDQTDEDLFRALPAAAVSIRVGAPFSHARFRVNDHRDVRRLLSRLIATPRLGSNRSQGSA
jgi:trehalose 6-phosphate synthase/phosphatase